MIHCLWISTILFLFVQSGGGNWFGRNKEAIIIGIAVTVIFGVIPSVIANIITKERRRKKKELEKYFTKSNEKPSKLVPKDIFVEKRTTLEFGFHEKFYIIRPNYDQSLLNYINAGKNVLIIGEPLSGKTRLVYNTIKSLESYRIWIPKHTNFDNSIFPYLKTKKKDIVVFDDMDTFTSEQSLPGLIRELDAKGFIIIGTCKEGIEHETLSIFIKDNNIFHEMIKIEKMEEENKEYTDIRHRAKDNNTPINEKQFNGTIGSLFYPLETMKSRFDGYDSDEKYILRSLRKLNMAGLYTGRNRYSIDRVKKVCESEGMKKNEYDWNVILEGLQTNGFIGLIDKNIIEIDDVYFQKLERVGEIVSFQYKKEITLDDVLEEMLELFNDDKEVLLSLANKAVEKAFITRQVQTIRLAISIYDAILKFYTYDRTPRDYGTTQNNLGIAYAELSLVENKAGNCKLAIEAYEQALKVRTLEQFPYDYAATQNNLGNAYVNLFSVENKADSIKLAIKAFLEALKVRTLEVYPNEYAMTQNNLGNAYFNLSLVKDKADNCKLAIKACDNALKVIALETYPNEYAKTQNNLGNAYFNLSLVEDKASNINLAIKAFLEVLRVRTLEAYPNEYATIQNDIGTAYVNLSSIEGEADNRKLAIQAYKEALKVYTLEVYSYEYATTQNNLGTAYLGLSSVEDKADNRKLAIQAYKEALKVYTLEVYPYEYATTQNDIGTAYLGLSLVEDEADNRKLAIKAFLEALKVRTLETYPYEYATTQNDLGGTYAKLSEIEDKADNSKLAIRAFLEALKVRTLEAYPNEYAMTQNNLGNVYCSLSEIENKVYNLKLTIKAYNESLRIWTPYYEITRMNRLLMSS